MGIQSLLFQIYQILLLTLLSINRQQLSASDAFVAAYTTSSPLAVYLAVASISDLFGTRMGLYKRIKSHHLIIRGLGALVLPLWTGLSMITWVSRKAFNKSSCSHTTFADWLMYLLFYVFTFITSPGFLYGFLPPYTPTLVFLPILFFLVKCRSQVAAGVRAFLKGASEPWRLILFFTPLGWIVLICVFIKCAWCVPVATIL